MYQSDRQRSSFADSFFVTCCLSTSSSLPSSSSSFIHPLPFPSFLYSVCCFVWLSIHFVLFITHRRTGVLLDCVLLSSGRVTTYIISCAYRSVSYFSVMEEGSIVLLFCKNVIVFFAAAAIRNYEQFVLRASRRKTLIVYLFLFISLQEIGRDGPRRKFSVTGVTKKLLLELGAKRLCLQPLYPGDWLHQLCCPCQSYLPPKRS